MFQERIMIETVCPSKYLGSHYYSIEWIFSLGHPEICTLILVCVYMGTGVFLPFFVSLSAFLSSYSPLFPLHCPCSVLLSPLLLSPSPGLAHTHMHTPSASCLFSLFFPLLAPSLALTFCTGGITCFRAFRLRQKVQLQSQLQQSS